MQDLGLELELAVRNGTSSASTLTGGNATRQRRHYASLDPTSMGVDVQIGPVMNMRSPDFDNNHQAGNILFSLKKHDTCGMYGLHGIKIKVSESTVQI